MKKRILFSILMIGMVMGTQAQKPTMTLTFTAEINGQHVPLNSILIENLTQGGDTTLFAPDTVLIMDYITGVSENKKIGENELTIFQNYPNPMEGKTKVSFYLYKKEYISITINDIIGRVLINKEYQLEQGNHTFIFYPGKENLYFFTARTFHQIQTIKMFNSPNYANRSGNYELEYNGQRI